ncbi:MAG: isoprenylcysteine carboxylmethyltransferase family protein [Bacteroidetes bacterium]|nr:isoprenylcysteine carboxylmethyltransferase family protein [Bacteroidota bacterium]
MNKIEGVTKMLNEVNSPQANCSAGMNGKIKITTILGWLAVIIFVVIYGVELLPHQEGPPVTVRWISETFGRSGLIVLNILIVLAFLALLPYRRPTKHIWKSRGTFAAFVLALMTEMFGWPLVIFLLSPLVNIPEIGEVFEEGFKIFGLKPALVGTAISFLGLAVIVIGWTQIHRGTGLVKTGIYRFMRHPQYTGILLFTLGWLVHWPSIVTLALWPLLIIMYVWLAKQEEKQAIDEYGDDYIAYAKQTKRFIPYVI